MRDWLKKLSEMPALQLRLAGMVAMVVGLGICWFVDPVSVLK
jgi:uncharacterized protein YjeT (DUF2065 family)